ncbi:MAG: hypothetical protein ACRDNF_18770 [Streptosporangiaceae bacterium]
MRRSPSMMAALGSVLLGAALLAGTGAAVAITHSSGVSPDVGTWGTAIEVPGIATLNAGGTSGVAAVSCGAAGTCAAGGSYTDSSSHLQAFVVDEVDGTWGTAQEIPGTAALNLDGRAAVQALSCGGPGTCAAGGYYTDGGGHVQAFVVDETAGVWGTAQEVPGTSTLNVGTRAVINSISCRSAGNCGAGGYYTDSSGDQQAFVDDETAGVWGTAQEVPGTASLDAAGHAGVASVSCSSPGNCGAGGYYASSTDDAIPTIQAFVANEVDGTWGTAQEVPGTATGNGGGFAETYAISCATDGNCTAGGDETNTRPITQAWAATEANGTWGNARLLPALVGLNKTGFSQIGTVSCAAAGDCSAGGFYTGGTYNEQAFVVTQRNGTWGSAEEVPGTHNLNQGASGGATTTSVSCSAPANCGAVGFYNGRELLQQVFVVSQVGSWHTAEEAPGSQSLNTGGAADLSSVSCPSPGFCAAGGHYTIPNGATATQKEAFVVNESKGA